MAFGTLQSIQRQSQPTQKQDELELDDNFDTENELDSDELEGFEEDPQEALADKLMSLRAEIDAILDQMGYSDEDESEQFGNDFDDQFADDSGDLDTLDRPSDDVDLGLSDFDDEQEDNSEEDDTDFFDDRQIAGDDAAGEDELPPTEEDSDFQGNIRTVAGADLVYKRKDEDGNYEELWIYNVGKDIKKETQIRRAILAGTDIVPNQRESEDGTQRSETYTVGNVQYLKISGLPN